MPKTPTWPPKSAPRLFVTEQLNPGSLVELSGSAAHYLSRVMRVTMGDIVILCDNQTGEWAADITSIGKRDVTLAVTQQLRPREQVPDFWLCPALLKKDRFDLVLEKATELGVRAIRPVIARRCVADKLNTDRAVSIITEAAEQCARTALPALAPVEKLSIFLARWPAGRTLFFADENGGAPADQTFRNTRGPAALLTGPEGGFDDAERALLLAHPEVKPITLGPRILRGETAAIAATALWMGVAGDW
ncbi:16S rRNA (uracil(1498)-N(3))-methyltransferase [Pontixanthobacter sp.]|uniref:16S rRNA (uracil(1498)-N(3))-methyltransferase n=1 Tax=Pontixanthobacter sp. TaxID=2792078 RepID=UPI003C7DE102